METIEHLPHLSCGSHQAAKHNGEALSGCSYISICGSC